MPIQTFEIYTKKGYAGELCDSGPRTTQTGILTSTTLGFGLAVKRDSSVERGVEAGGAAKVFGISMREYNHEADTRPSDGTTSYKETESVSVMRQGYIYLELGGSVAIAAGDVVHVDTTTGVFSKAAVAGNVVATTNVTAEEAAIAGDIFRARIDIVA